MRSAARRRSVCAVGEVSRLPFITRLPLDLLPNGRGAAAALVGGVARPQPEQMADRVDQIGAVHGVEVEIGDAAVDEIEHLLGGDRGGDELAGGRIVIEAVEALGQPIRHRGAAARRERLGLLEILHRQDAGHDRHVDAAGAHPVEIAEVVVVLEEELGDRARRAGIDLGREHVEVGLDRRAVGMLFRIGRDRDLDVGQALDAGDEIGGIAIAAGMRRVALAETADRIAAQRHDVAHARRAIAADHGVDLVAGGGDAGEMRRRRERGFARMRLTVAWVRSRVEPPAP